MKPPFVDEIIIGVQSLASVFFVSFNFPRRESQAAEYYVAAFSPEEAAEKFISYLMNNATIRRPGNGQYTVRVISSDRSLREVIVNVGYVVKAERPPQAGDT